MDLDNCSRCSGGIGIRPYRSDDAPALAAAVQASLDDLRRWLPWAREAYGPEDARAWIEDRRQAWDEGEAYSFAVVQPSGEGPEEPDGARDGGPDDTGFLGGVGINRIDRQNRVGNVGYWVRTRATGRGVATTAVRLAARIGFEQAGLRRLEFFVSVENEASQRVAEKVGARREGVLRRRLRMRERVDDAFLYALLPDDLIGAHHGE